MTPTCLVCRVDLARRPAMGPPRVVRGVTLCQTCYDSFVAVCEGCGHEEWVSGSTGMGLCSICGLPVHTTLRRRRRGEDRRFGMVVYPYLYKPTPVFHGVGPVFYGLELEFETFGRRFKLGRFARQIAFYLKFDCSLNDGAEMVFHPRSLESWAAAEPHLEQLCRALSSGGADSDWSSTCGLHVHRSRVDLTQLDLARLVMGFGVLGGCLRWLARRSSETFASFTVLECNATPHRALGYVRDSRSQSRQTALNLSPPATVEVRMFQGTLEPRKILAAIGLSHYLVEWLKRFSLRQLGDAAPDQLWRDFLIFLAHQVVRKRPLARTVAQYVESTAPPRSGADYPVVFQQRLERRRQTR